MIGILKTDSHRISFHKLQVTDIERSFGICNPTIKICKNESENLYCLPPTVYIKTGNLQLVESSKKLYESPRIKADC